MKIRKTRRFPETGPEYPYVTVSDLTDQALQANKNMQALMKAGVEYTELRHAVVEAAKVWREDWLLNSEALRLAVDALIDFEQFRRNEILNNGPRAAGCEG